MRNILIVSNFLTIGGGEKLIYELCLFAKENNINVTVLILDNYNIEYYDPILTKMNVKIVRTRIKNIKHLRAPVKMIKSAYWVILLKYFANKTFSSVHIIGLYNLDKVYDKINHNHRLFWNINNAEQFSEGIYPISGEYLRNSNDKVVCINKYQVEEIYTQYERGNVETELLQFKLFLKENDEY